MCVDQMTPRERMYAFKHQQAIDRIPCGLCPGDYIYKLVGDSVSDLYLSSKQIVKSQIQARQVYEIQSAGTGPVVNGIAEAVGCKVIYPKHDTPYISEHIINDYGDYKRLEIPEPRKSGRLNIILEALEELLECLGNELPIVSEIPGPLTTASNLRGIENLMIDLYENPEFAKEIIEFSLRCTVEYMNEASKLGVEFSISDPVASLIGDSFFQEFEFPFLKELVQNVVNLTKETPLLHICGNTTKLLGQIADTGAGIISLDEKVDMEAAKNEIGTKIALYGNISPTKVMLSGSPLEICIEAKKCIQKAYDNPKGFVLGLGCGMPIDTPEENIYALLESARKFGRYPLKGELNINENICY
ncbi:uroporphyrinogen decarboxylase family protein [Ruminiclostridium papyrosolvens]|uniref:Uroporphyrinogen decarboxylase n=1 Tax=Ruminiclostridium papyrosolvens C7 TaxID=1330534 RepID=U4R4R1_9FIRM|nr:uroporphyrinogen decarboxylase family protein [Ruminiclostridium papyrosolvens]EPR13557.1 uroporphyrinogen decarboxylase [Ruminiclostridium papyrosolvens C7]